MKEDKGLIKIFIIIAVLWTILGGIMASLDDQEIPEAGVDYPSYHYHMWQ